MFTIDGKTTTIQPGDIIYYDKSSGSLIFLRQGTNIYKTELDNSGHDDKFLFSLIKKEIDLFETAKIIAETHNLSLRSFWVSLATPAYQFIEKKQSYYRLINR